MPPPFTRRRLGPADLVLVRRLNRLFGEAFAEPETYAGAPPDDVYFQDQLGKEHIIVLAALAGETPVGGLVAYEHDKFEQARREVYLYDLAVAAAHRRQGVATALIGELRRIALERCAWAVFVQADHGDDAAIALYGSLGVREDVIHFDVGVGVPPRGEGLGRGEGHCAERHAWLRKTKRG